MARSITFLFFVLTIVGCDNDETANNILAEVKPEATYQGKKLSAWTKQLEHEDVKTRRLAAKAIEEMGKNAADALPTLEKVLAKSGEDSIVRFVAAVSVWQMTQETRRVMSALLSMLRSNNSETQYRAALALEIIGPPALAAGPNLQKIIDTYNKLDYSRLGYDEQLLLATAKDALAKIEGRDELD